MSTATLEMPSMEQDTFTVPETAEEFQHLVEDELGQELVETTEAEVNAEKLLWRGHNPREVVGLLEGQLDAIEIHSDKPNVTLDWHKAIAYNSGGEGIKYNMVMGFMPPDKWDSKPAEKTVAADLLQYRDVAEYQRGNFVGNGRVGKENLRFIIVRGHGQAGQDVGPCHFYKVAA